MRPPTEDEKKTQVYLVGVTLYAAKKDARYVLSRDQFEFTDEKEAGMVAKAVGGQLIAPPNMEKQTLTRAKNGGVKKGEIYEYPDRTLAVGCSNCGWGLSMKHHHLTPAGEVKPSIICPMCNAHYWAKVAQPSDTPPPDVS